MIINRLEIQGFKSFPDRTRIIFHPGITAIIGPNGTGKSNIVDALLWVLGGQRQKALRGEKTEDIIFTGAQKKAPLGMADVTLALQSDEEEIVINHRLFRSGESEYRLNGKPARLKDIQDRLWKSSISGKEYFVIEQGAIGLLLTSKPVEKRQLVEEAAGTAFYKDKKKQAQSKLESSEQNLVRIEDIIAEVSRAKNSLARQAAAASRYRKLRERIRELTALHFAGKLALLEKKHAETLSLFEACLNEEKELTALIREGEKHLTHKRTSLWGQEKALKEAKERLRSLESQIHRVEAEKDAKRVEILEEKRRYAQADIEELEQETIRLGEESGRGQAVLRELEEMLRLKEEETSRLEAESLSSRDMEVSGRAAMEALRAEHFHKLSILTEARNEGAGAEKERELLLRQEEKLEGRLRQEETLLQETENELDLIRQNLVRRRAIKEEKEGTVARLRKNLSETEGTISRLEASIRELTRKRDGVSYELQALQKIEKKERDARLSPDLPQALGILADFLKPDPDYAPLVDVFWKEESRATAVPASILLAHLAEKEVKGNIFILSSRGEMEIPAGLLDEQDVLGMLKSRLSPQPGIKEYFPSLPDAVIVRDVAAAVRLWLRFPGLSFITPAADLLLPSGLMKLGQKEEGIFSLGLEMQRLEEHLRLLEEETAPLSVELEKLSGLQHDLERQTLEETSLIEEEERKIQEEDRRKTAAETRREKALSGITLLKKEIEALRRDGQTLSQKCESISRSIGVLGQEEVSLQKRLEAEDRKLTEEREQKAQEGKALFELKAACSLLGEKIRHWQEQTQSLIQRKKATSEKTGHLLREIVGLEKELSGVREHILSLEHRARGLEEEKRLTEAEIIRQETEFQKLQAEEEEGDKRLQHLREESEIKKEKRVRWEVAKAEVERDLTNLEETCRQELKKTLREVKDETAQIELFGEEIDRELAQAEDELQKYKAVNLMAEEEYLSQKQRFDFLVQQKNDLRESIDATQEAIRKIDEESKAQFLAAVTEINKNFQEIFSLLFKGGNAEVKLTDPENSLESGIELVAQPPGKKVQNIALLSGGEKSLTSLAFLFALFRFKPTPFCILDEVDAALDEVNSKRFLEMMATVKKETQFIIVTHNYKTMEVADYIYGTTMDEPNVTKLLSVRLEKKEANQTAA